MDVTINNITTTITVPQVDFKLLKELAKKFGWVIQAEKKSGIEEAMEDVKAGRVFHAKDAHDLIKQCLEWNTLLTLQTDLKKSLRKGVKRGLDPTLIEKAVEKLANDGKLPPSYKSHKLHGNLEGIWECHITPDWLMLWEQNDEKLTLLFLNNGTHSDLFWLWYTELSHMWKLREVDFL